MWRDSFESESVEMTKAPEKIFLRLDMGYLQFPDHKRCLPGHFPSRHVFQIQLHRFLDIFLCLRDGLSLAGNAKLDA